MMMMMIEKDDDECESIILNFFQVLLEYSNEYDSVSP